MNERRFSYWIIAFTAALTLAAVLVYFLRENTIAYLNENDPASVVNNYLTAILLDDYEKAYAYLGEWENKPSYEAFVDRQSTLDESFKYCAEISDHWGNQIKEQEVAIYIATYNCDERWQADWETWEDTYDADYDKIKYIGPGDAYLRQINTEWKIEQLPLPWWDTSWLIDWEKED